jgi:hypothetical protein
MVKVLPTLIIGFITNYEVDTIDIYKLVGLGINIVYTWTLFHRFCFLIHGDSRDVVKNAIIVENIFMNHLVIVKSRILIILPRYMVRQAFISIQIIKVVLISVLILCTVFVYVLLVIWHIGIVKSLI